VTMFYVNDGTRQWGPLDETALIGMLQRGDIRGGHFCTAGQNQWYPMQAHPGFAHAMARATGMPSAYTPTPSVPGASLNAPADASAVPMLAASKKPRASGRRPHVALIAAVLGVVTIGGIATALLSRSKRPGPATPPSARLTRVEVRNRFVEIEFVASDNTTRVRMPVGARCTPEQAARPPVGDVVFTRSYKYVCEPTRLSSLSATDRTARRRVLEFTLEGPRYTTTTLPVEYEVRPAMEVSGFNGTWRVSCEVVSCRGTFHSSFLLDLQVPPGTRVHFAGQDAVAQAGQPLRIQGNLEAQATALPLAKLYGSDTHYEPIRIAADFPDGTHVEQQFRVTNFDLRGVLARQLERVRSGPVLFPGEAAGGSGRRNMVVVPEGRLIGTAQRATDLDLIAIETNQVRTRGCGRYVNRGTGEARGYSVSKVDETYTVYERRTGRRVAQRRFNGTMPACPTGIGSAAPDEARGRPEVEVVNAWLLSHLAL
jgi:hypothetical protein